LVFSTTILTASQVNDYEKFKFDQLKKIASEKGYVRVIIKMDVPDIKALTDMSTSFKTGNSPSNRTFRQAAYNADLGLEYAISLTTDGVLHRLNGTFYRVNSTYKTLPFVALTVTADTVERLKTIPEILDIVEDKPAPLPEPTEPETAGDENDIDRPMLDRSVEIVGANTAWGFGYTGQDWYVAILDTGLRTSHEMFQGKHIIEQCFARGDSFNDLENGHCPNGKISMSGPGSAAHFQDRFGHGSHVAGIATGNNGVDRFGVARDANIIAVNVFSYVAAWDDVGAYGADVLDGLEFVYTLRNDYKIASTNLSLGGGAYYNFCNDFRTDAINNLRAAGIASAISSGNDGLCNAVGAPACIPGAVTVNGTDKDDNVYGGGNWDNEMVDLMAPGVSINSAVALGDATYGGKTGTSMAAPHVAGAWAIMRQYDENMSVDEILMTLQDNGTPITSYNCSGTETRFNVANALMSLFVISPPANIAGEQKTNRSLLQTEYINELSWDTNPYNAGKNITRYRIYVVGGGNQLTNIGEVDSSTFTFWHRKVSKREAITYAVTSVNADGAESPPYYYTLEFGITQ
ncbi:MAG: S8 family serine peptidase, partial [bacterium]|nr:S8 family serine peptidase [bacterium]